MEKLTFLLLFGLLSGRLLAQFNYPVPPDYAPRLFYIQRTLAYGIKSNPAGSLNEYIFHLVSYSKRNFMLKKDHKGRPVVSLTINGKEAYLKRIFVELDPGFLGITPNIQYVENLWCRCQNGKLGI